LKRILSQLEKRTEGERKSIMKGGDCFLKEVEKWGNEGGNTGYGSIKISARGFRYGKHLEFR